MSADYLALGAIFVIVAFILVTLAISGARTELTGPGGAVERLLVSSFVALLLGFTLAVLGMHGLLKEQDQERIVIIVNIGATIVAALLIVGSLTFHCCRVSRTPPIYTSTLVISSVIMAALSAAFYITEIIQRST